MSNVWFTADLHFGHIGIGKFRKFISDDEDNRAYISSFWLSHVKKRDTVYVLGDSAFTEEALEELGKLPGRKILIRGNHDELPIASYLKVFDEVYGLKRYKGFWLSHAPIHPKELRGKVNLHGHVHYKTLPDPRYLNCSIEGLREEFGYPLVNLATVREYYKWRLDANTKDS